MVAAIIAASTNTAMTSLLFIIVTANVITEFVCHCGDGSEAGSGVCYIKFGIGLSDNYSQENFRTLLNATSLLAKDRRLSRIVAGVNTE
jgi:hypothetical protein